MTTTRKEQLTHQAKRECAMPAYLRSSGSIVRNFAGAPQLTDWSAGP